ncbi:MAG: metalloregulator ArsR/SmtB family transcription factor [Myxococcales bacterium]
MHAQPLLDATFAALADPTRRAIVARLAEGDATVLELAEPFQISLPAISRHLKVLERAGLITRGRDAQRRPCSLRVDSLREVAEWTEHTRRAWEARFERLDEYLRELQSAPSTKSTKPQTKKAVKQEGRDHGRKTR